MSTVLKICRYELTDTLRSRWIILYAILLFIITELLLRFGGNPSSALISMMNIILMVIPLVSVVFGSLYLYNSREFMELLLCQPLSRTQMFFGLYLGIALSLILGFLSGIVIPMLFRLNLFYDNFYNLISLLVCGTGLTLIFLSIAFYISIINQDRIKGLGISLLIWLFFIMIYDGIILSVIYFYADYPLEKPVLIMSFANPIDLARIFLLMKFNISALMGYTGAVFQRFFGTTLGLTTAMGSLLIWFVVPVWMGYKKYINKDF